MMRALTLEEFAEDMRRKGDIRQADMADDILMLLDLETEVAEPYSDLCSEIEQYAADYSNPDDATKALEWLADRSNMLAEIEKQLVDANRPGDADADADADDAVKELLGTLAKIRDIAGVPDTATDEDVENAIQALVENAPTPKEYDL